MPLNWRTDDREVIRERMAQVSEQHHDLLSLFQPCLAQGTTGTE
jgi:hypothetical protein